MAITAHNNSVASLMQRTLDRQASLARSKFKLLKSQVQNVLVSLVHQNNYASYNELVRFLKEWPISDDNLKVLLEDCISSIVLLGPETRSLVEAICSSDWSGCTPDIVELYTTFSLSLVTAHIYHSPLVMSSLVKQFKVEGELWEDDPPEKMVSKWSNVHSLIAKIVAVIPMSSDILLKTIVEQYPYYKAGSYVNRAYVHNLIWITKYIPSTLEQIMTAIVTRMIVMDVNISEKSKQKHQVEDTFIMEINGAEDDISVSLDYCMMEMLDWLQDERDTALNAMCNVFERVVLPTYSIKNVQFLLLYAISISQQCADRVLNNLWVVAAGLHALGPGALATRRTASSHLAGLLARCVRVPNTRLVKYLKAMAEWCHAYVTATQESTTASDNVKVHGAFHAVCHAVFYLIAFKHQHLFITKESISFVESLNLPRLVTCNLNPLRTCPPAVTRAFSSVTRAHQVVYCQAIIEKNARHTLQASGPMDYDEWFPYDPYTLPRSGKIIWPLCLEYKEWLNENEDETQYSNRVKKLETEDDDFLVSASPSMRIASSLSNCISPGFKYM